MRGGSESRTRWGGLGGRPKTPKPVRNAWRYYRRYWRWVIRTVIRNVGGHWPIFLSFLTFPLTSGALLYLAELGSASEINTYPNAVYATWITMATVGYGDMVPVTGLGRLIVSFDALVGLVLVGSLVWLFTSTLREYAGLPDEEGDEPGPRHQDEED